MYKLDRTAFSMGSHEQVERQNQDYSNWEKSRNAYNNYEDYIVRNRKLFQKHTLTLIDLFYVKNFKGGSAVFGDSENSINQKLKKYASVLDEIESRFGEKANIKTLDDSQLSNLKSFGVEFISLEDNIEFKIKGLSTSFCTTILHFHFPNLYPIMDRRVLINSEIVTSKEKEVDTQGQVIKMKAYYERLIDKVRDSDFKTINDFDKHFFSLNTANDFKRESKKK